MKTETLQPARVSLLRVVNDSPLPLDHGLLRHLYKTDLPATQAAVPQSTNVDDSANWDAAWFASYE